MLIIAQTHPCYPRAIGTLNPVHQQKRESFDRSFLIASQMLLWAAVSSTDLCQAVWNLRVFSLVVSCEVRMQSYFVKVIPYFKGLTAVKSSLPLCNVGWTLNVGRRQLSTPCQRLPNTFPAIFNTPHHQRTVTTLFMSILAPAIQRCQGAVEI